MDKLIQTIIVGVSTSNFTSFLHYKIMVNRYYTTDYGKEQNKSVEFNFDLKNICQELWG